MIVPVFLAVDFINFTYAKNPCSQNVPVPVVMEKGSFAYFDQKMGVGFDLRVDGVTRGSLSNGTHQAVVVIVCDLPIGGTAAAYLFDERSNGATLLQQVAEANWGPDWGAGPQSIHIRFAGNFLYVDSCKDNQCALSVVDTYALRNGKIRKVFSQTHPSR